MTFDDGVLRIYQTENISEAGEMPVEKIELKSEHYFGFDVLGYSRYYTALQAQQNISLVVNIPDWHDISVLDLAELEDGNRYIIRMHQPMKDENGLNITKLSLERVVQDA
ncbi:MAG: hypothetical protein IKT73_04900 [Anaerotignum sp.]|nr:hypothetical protein [Anaerotignum sp.]